MFIVSTFNSFALIYWYERQSFRSNELFIIIFFLISLAKDPWLLYRLVFISCHAKCTRNCITVLNDRFDCYRFNISFEIRFVIVSVIFFSEKHDTMLRRSMLAISSTRKHCNIIFRIFAFNMHYYGKKHSPQWKKCVTNYSGGKKLHLQYISLSVIDNTYVINCNVNNCNEKLLCKLPYSFVMKAFLYCTTAMVTKFHWIPFKLIVVVFIMCQIDFH